MELIALAIADTTITEEAVKILSNWSPKRVLSVFLSSFRCLEESETPIINDLLNQQIGEYMMHEQMKANDLDS